MEDKRLNFGRPFVPFPLYKTELKSGPVCCPGTVPFEWEKSPGMPKTTAPSDSIKSSFEDCITEEEVSTTTSTCLGDDADGEAKEYSDTLDELSRTESFFFNCSLGGISGLEGGMDETSFGIPSSEVQDLMIGRFLPAAKAMAAEMPTRVNRKQPTRVEETVCISRGSNVQKQIRYEECKPDLSPNYAPELYRVEAVNEDEDGEFSLLEDRSTRGCGLLTRFCIKAPCRVISIAPAANVKDGDPINKLHSRSSNKLFHSWLKQKSASQDGRSNPKIYDLSRLSSKASASPKPENSPLPSKIQLHHYHPRFSFDEGRTTMYVLDTKRRNDSLPKGKPSTCFRDLLVQENEEWNLRSKVSLVEKNIFADHGREGESRVDAIESETDYRSAAVGHPKPTIRNKSNLGQQQGKADSNMSMKSGTPKRGSDPLITRLREANHEKSRGHYSNVPLSPPLPNSPSESWLDRTLPVTPSPKSRAFLCHHRL